MKFQDVTFNVRVSEEQRDTLILDIWNAWNKSESAAGMDEIKVDGVVIPYEDVLKLVGKL